MWVGGGQFQGPHAAFPSIEALGAVQYNHPRLHSGPGTSPQVGALTWTRCEKTCAFSPGISKSHEESEAFQGPWYQVSSDCIHQSSEGLGCPSL